MQCTFFLFQIDNADPPFPRPAGYWWFGCSQNEGIVPDNNNNDGNGVGNGGGEGGITFPSNDSGAGGITFPSNDGDGANNVQGEGQGCKEIYFQAF